ncbi:hypothetical protein KDJ56_07295 [Brevibacillus composti]|uniref:Uncharacterized protein n=1 Tax=Brevibacillus composti TaxID=2796470 RepID=A0A7T5JQ41_9BACL|nr:hypothetical protein [Brevibacillus composti]QQE75736.1 hypothetical protein JD108_07615 [Brevibacillus composti]QUO42762.1 hypothetical protein KDJ56_07295 [Brevibacillus composti]
MVSYSQIGIALAAIAILVLLVLTFRSIRKSEKLVGFWNDLDGLSITDTMSVLIVGSYILFLVPFAYKLVKGSLTMNDVSLVGQAIIPVTTVLGGYYVEKTAKNFSRKEQQKGEDYDARV